MTLLEKMMTKDFLLEIGCAELPAKGLFAFSQKTGAFLSEALKKADLPFEAHQCFATPRRLAVQIKALAGAQPNRQVERRGPGLKAPQAAIEGFARSCGVALSDLIDNQSGYWVYRYEEKGKQVTELMPSLIQQMLKNLSGVKWMRWGNHTESFLRPVEWLVMLYGDQVIEANMLTQQSGNHTRGHRFHHPGKILLSRAEHYEEILFEEAFVMADFTKRRESILAQIKKLAAEKKLTALIDTDLLDEVTGLVEWPVALLCEFPAKFLEVPKEALISSMQQHQKCFPLINSQGELAPYFITISNIQSRAPEAVMQGNERVMQARLADAAFFYEEDKKLNFSEQFARLQKIIFQQKLGTLADKVLRVENLSQIIAKQLHADPEKSQHAARLCKLDLTTSMVNEFPELQGIMGEYYARFHGEPDDIARAIREHYLPRFAGDELPKSILGCVLAIADRIDTLNSIFSIGQIPTGDKDPFALRRAALGLVRIIIEKQLSHMDIKSLVPEIVYAFILDRLPAYYQEQSIPLDAVQAVLEVARDNNLYDIHERILAVQAFRALPEASALSEANKRVKNILKKNNISAVTKIDESLFMLPAEKNLYAALQAILNKKNKDYAAQLNQLAGLKTTIDQFFVDVLVDAEEAALKQNRLNLLALLRKLFLAVADISLLG